MPKPIRRKEGKSSSARASDFDNGEKSKSSWIGLFILSIKIVGMFSYALFLTCISRIFPTEHEYKSRTGNGTGPSSENAENDPYQILGLGKDADIEIAKKAYRKLALQYHPDRMAGRSDEEKLGAEEKMKKVNWAYERIQKNLSDDPDNEKMDTNGYNSGDNGTVKRPNSKNRPRQHNHTNANKPREAYDEDDDVKPNSNFGNRQSQSTGNNQKSRKQAEEDLEKQYKEFQKRHTKESKIFQQEKSRQEGGKWSMQLGQTSEDGDAEEVHLNPADKATKKKHVGNPKKKKHVHHAGGQGSSSLSTNKQATKPTTQTTTETPPPVATEPVLPEDPHVNVKPTAPLSVFDTCNDDLATCIRLDLELIFLQLADPEVSRYTLLESLDSEGNTALHYCAYFNRYVIGERVITFLGSDWSTAMLCTNDNGQTPSDIAMVKHRGSSTGTDSSTSQPASPPKDPSSLDFAQRLISLAETAKLHRETIRAHTRRIVDLSNLGPIISVLVSLYLSNKICYLLSGCHYIIFTVELVLLSVVFVAVTSGKSHLTFLFEGSLLITLGGRFIWFVALNHPFISTSVVACIVFLLVCFRSGLLMKVIVGVLMVHVIIATMLEWCLHHIRNYANLAINLVSNAIVTRLLGDRAFAKNQRTPFSNTSSSQNSNVLRVCLIRDKLLLAAESFDGQKCVALIAFGAIFGILCMFIRVFVG